MALLINNFTTVNWLMGVLTIFQLVLINECMIEVNPKRGVGNGIFGRRWAVAPSSRCTYFVNDDADYLFIKKHICAYLLAVLSLFTVVQWGQSLCQAPSGEYGTCLPNSECSLRGGIPGGPCADGYGMCCVCKF